MVEDANPKVVFSFRHLLHCEPDISILLTRGSLVVIPIAVNKDRPGARSGMS